MLFLEIVAKSYECLACGAYFLALGLLCLFTISIIVYALFNFKQLSAEAANDIKDGWPFYLFLFIFGVIGPFICVLYNNILK